MCVYALCICMCIDVDALLMCTNTGRDIYNIGQSKICMTFTYYTFVIDNN